MVVAMIFVFPFSAIALIVHHTDKSGFMLHAHNSFLELTVNHNTVSDDDNIIKNDFVIYVMQ